MTQYNKKRSITDRISALEKQVRENNGANRLAHSSIHEGGINEYDEDGNLVSRVGEQHDGTHGAADLYGPKPPKPTSPALAGAPVSLTIAWDGHVVDENDLPRPLPLDFQAVQILAKKDEAPDLLGNDDMKGVITSEAGGEKSLTVEHGTWYVALRVRAKSGRLSDSSAVVSVEVPTTVDPAQVEADIAEAQADAAAAVSTANTALTSANGKNRISYGSSAPTASTPGRPGDIFWVRSGVTITAQYLNEAGTDTTSGNVWTAQTLTNTTIANLDAGKISTGFLDAARIGAKTISTEKLFIGSTDNLVDDPNFASLGTTNTVWGATSANIVADATGGRGGGTSLKLVLNGTERSVTSASQWKGAQPNAEYRMSMWVNSSVVLPQGALTPCIQQTAIESALVLIGTATSYVSTPDTAALKIAGDIDLRARVSLDDWTPGGNQTLISKWTTTGNQRSYAITVLTNGKLRLSWSPDGTTVIDRDSTVATGITDGSIMWVRAQLDVDNGGGGHTVTFFTSVDGELWLPLGDPVPTAGVTSIYQSTAIVNVGALDQGASNRVVGKIYSAEILAGLDGLRVADPEFAAQVGGATVFNDGALDWTVQSGASIVGSLTTVTELSSGSPVGAIPSGSWTFVSLEPESVSPRAVSIRPVVRVSASAGASGNVWVDQVTIARAATGNLVVDGAITAGKLATNSVTTEALAAGSVTGETFAGELFLGSRITTAESGPRVEMDSNGFRLYNASEEVRVNLPTDPDENPSFRGEVQADGLTVRQGASFYSTQNEFAKDSLITLAEQVAAPIAPPLVSTFWPSVVLNRVEMSGGLGTFALDPSLVQSVTWLPGAWNCALVIQKVPTGGSRVWYYNVTGGNPLEVWDSPASWDITSIGVGSDGQWRILYEAANKWWIYDYSRAAEPAGNRQRQYIPHDNPRRPLLTMQDNDIYIGQRDENVLKLRRVTTNTNPVTLAGGIVTSGTLAPNTELCALYRGDGDWGSTTYVASHRDSLSYRFFGTGGTYLPDNNFNPPVSKVGGFWHPDTSRFVTMGSDGRFYTHSPMTWSSESLGTWHLAQTFYDSNATGGTHETVIGGIRQFSPSKRAWVRTTLAQVPFAGGADDPNAWRLYCKTGTAPPTIGTGMTLQVSGAYTVTSWDFGSLPSTSGDAPPTLSNFPNATPARLISGRTMPLDSTKPIFEARGDGMFRAGPFEVDGAGAVVHPTPWTNDGISISQTGLVLTSVQYMVDATGRVNWRGEIYGTSTPSESNLLFSIPSTIAPTMRDFWTITGPNGTATIFTGQYGSAGNLLTQIRFRRMIHGSWPDSSNLSMSLTPMFWYL